MLFPRMNLIRLLLLFVIGISSSCAWVGPKNILQRAIDKAAEETLSVSLSEHPDGTASYMVCSPSGLQWKVRSLGYAPGKLGVDGVKQRDYYGVSPVSATNLSVVALQEHGELGRHALFVVQGRLGTLFAIESAKRSYPMGDGISFYYTWKVKGLSRAGMTMQASGKPMGKAFIKWRDLVVNKIGEVEAMDPRQKN